MLNESTNTGKLFKDCMNYYCDEIGIDYSSIYSYRLIVCLIHLHRSYYYLPVAEKNLPSPDSIGKIRYVSILEEELMRYGKSQDSDTS